tara:strand:+ start:557 stop:997 length:441 start_codon:yes stop_codon:yes gene_type:complete
MKINKEKPYVIYMAEIIYKSIVDIKKNNPDTSNIDAVEGFIGTSTYEEISSGTFHDSWFVDLKNNKFIDKNNGNKIPDETMRLLEIQKDITMKQLTKFPKLYYAKSYFPLEVSQRAFDYLWRVCESYELWCKETKQTELIYLNITD